MISNGGEKNAETVHSRTSRIRYASSRGRRRGAQDCSGTITVEEAFKAEQDRYAAQMKATWGRCND